VVSENEWGDPRLASAFLSGELGRYSLFTSMRSGSTSLPTMRMIKAVLTALLILTSLSHATFAAETANKALDRKVRASVFQHKLAVLDLPIGWQEIRGLSAVSAWQILGTMWRVHLYPETRSLDALDKTKKYVVHGIALEQGYGVIHVWVYDLKEK